MVFNLLFVDRGVPEVDRRLDLPLVVEDDKPLATSSTTASPPLLSSSSFDSLTEDSRSSPSSRFERLNLHMIVSQSTTTRLAGYGYIENNIKNTHTHIRKIDNAVIGEVRTYMCCTYILCCEELSRATTKRQKKERKKERVIRETFLNNPLFFLSFLRQNGSFSFLRWN